MDITILIIIVYFIAMILFGILIKKAKGASDFSTAKHTLTIGAITAGLVMTHFGGGFVLGGAELGYNHGFYGLVYGFSAAFGILVLGLFLSKKIHQESKKSDIKTIPSFLYKKFKDKKIMLMSSILSIIALTAIASAQLFAAVRIFSVLNIPVKLSAGILTIIVALISTKGIRALTKFGKYNLIIASIGAIAALVIAFKTTSLTNLTIQPTSFEILPFSSLLWILIPTVLYTTIGQDFHQKLYSAKNEKTIKIACIFSFFILLLLSFFPVIIGMQSKSLFLIQATEAMPKFIIFVFPSILKGLFIAAILAAIIGSAQSVINAAATQVSEDLIKPFKKLSDKQLGKIATISALILSISALVITLFSTSIIKNLIIAYTLYTGGMFIPVIVAFYLKKAEKIAKPIFLISIIGLMSTLIFEFKIVNTTIPSIILGVGVSSLILLLVLSSNYVITNKRLQIARFIKLKILDLI